MATPNWHWVQANPRDRSFHTCATTRGPRGRVRCELPPEHDDGWHLGRTRIGSWVTWTDDYRGHHATR